MIDWLVYVAPCVLQVGTYVMMHICFFFSLIKRKTSESCCTSIDFWVMVCGWLAVCLHNPCYFYQPRIEMNLQSYFSAPRHLYYQRHNTHFNELAKLRDFFQTATTPDGKHISHLEVCKCIGPRKKPRHRCGKTYRTARWRCGWHKHASAKAKAENESKLSKRCGLQVDHRVSLVRPCMRCQMENTPGATGVWSQETIDYELGVFSI